MARSLWKGHLAFGLVMIPVELVSAEAAARDLNFDLLDARDHSRVRYKRVNERSGKEVPWSSIVKGHQYETGKYVVLTPAEFRQAAKGVVRGAEIIDFVDAAAVSPIYFEKPYYLSPGKGGEKSYALLRDALHDSGRIGIAHLVIQQRQHLAALLVHEETLALITIRWPEELRQPHDAVGAIPRTPRSGANSRAQQMARQLIDGMFTEWDPANYKDEYRKALNRFIALKIKSGGKVARAAKDEGEDEPPASYNIMDLLQRSVESRRATGRGTPQRHGRKAG
jgi:DNA end-binding protein Ku